MKGLDDIIALVQRHAPALTVHLLLFLWLTFVVLDPATLPDGGATWTRIAAGIDGSLNAVGLSLQRWYVLAAVLIAYFTLFEWTRNVVAALLPVARIGATRERVAPDLFAYAGAVLRLPPEPWQVRKALNLQIKRATERVRLAGGRHPYQYLLDRQAAWTRYHGTLFVVLLAVVAWGAAGAPYARSPARVWWTAALLLALCLGIRAVIRRLRSEELTATSYWALGELDPVAPDADPLYYERSKATRRAADVASLLERHPTGLVGRLALGLPARLRDRVFARLASPVTGRDDLDWRLVTARYARRADETVAPPAALGVDAYVARFAALLECPGAGLCVLAPQGAGLAPAAAMGGAVYSFTRRQHAANDFAIRLEAAGGLDPSAAPRLWVDAWTNIGFIARIGDHPIEQLAEGRYPSTLPWLGASFTYRRLDADVWTALAAGAAPAVDGITLGRDAALDAGASYLLGLRTASGAEARAVAQCFRIAGEDKLLVAWRVIEAPEAWRERPLPVIAPWWHPGAWRGLLRPPPAPPGQ